MTALPLPVSGLEIRLRLAPGSLTDVDKDAAELYIADATALVMDEVNGETEATWNVDIPRVVELIIYKAARREWENPSGLSQEISGEHTITTQATSGVFLTPMERQKIRKAAGLALTSVGTITLTPPDSPLGPYWWRRRW